MRFLASTRWGGVGVKPPPHADINQAHPLAQGLLGYWLLGETEGLVPDAVTGQLLTQSADLAVTRTESPYGPAGSFAGSTYVNATANARLQPNLPVSVFTLVNPTSFGAFRGIFSSSDGDTAYSGILLGADGSNTYAWWGDNTGVSNATRQGVFGPALSTATWYAFGASLRGPTSDISLYINGIKQTVTAFGSGGSIAYGGGIGIGRCSNTGIGNAWSGSIAAVGYWARNLTDDEHLLLANDPFCMFALPHEPLGRVAPVAGTIMAPFIAATGSVYQGSLVSASTVATVGGQGGAIAVG